MKIKKVLIIGPSGTGKTTLAKELSKVNDYDLIYESGSINGLLDIKIKNQYDIMQFDYNHLHARNIQILNARKKVLNKYREDSNYGVIMDRGGIDAIVFDIFKNSDQLNTCDLTDMVQFVNKFHIDSGITHIIFIPYDIKQYNEFNILSEGRRISNGYFHMMISRIYKLVIDMIGYKKSIWNIFRKNPIHRLYIHEDNWYPIDLGIKGESTIKLLTLNERDLGKRVKISRRFLR